MRKPEPATIKNHAAFIWSVADLLRGDYKVLSRFTEIDLHPDAVSNIEMGYLYEELIRPY